VFDFSLGNFRLLPDLVRQNQKEQIRSSYEDAQSIRVYVTERTDGGYQGLSANGRRVSDMVDYTGMKWVNSWVTAERTDTGYVIVGGAAFEGAPPDPVVDGDGG